MDDGGAGGGMVTAPDMTGDGSLAPCGMAIWPGIRSPPDGGLHKFVHIHSHHIFSQEHNIYAINVWPVKIPYHTNFACTYHQRKLYTHK